MNSGLSCRLVSLLFLLTVPMLAMAQGPAASAEVANQAIQQAESARAAAAEAGAEWLETGKLIGMARQAADGGDFEKAAELAEKARLQGELAVAQAEREAGAWTQRVVR